MVAKRTSDDHTILGNYKILSVLKSGAVGETHMAQVRSGPHEGELVCLKILRADYQDQPRQDPDRRDAIASLLREADFLSGGSHPHIPAFYEQGAYGDSWFIAMEFIPGANLWELLALRDDRGLAPEDVRRIALQVLDALQFAHDQGVLHRDIKPGNIMVRRDRHVCLVDFGIAKVAYEMSSRFTRQQGTACYAAPEQLLGKRLTPAADLYALGVTLWELLTGKQPRHCVDELDLEAPEIPADLRPVLAKCTADDPADRYSSAAELATVLHHMQFAQPTTDIGFIATRFEELRPELAALAAQMESDSGSNASIAEDGATSSTRERLRTVPIDADTLRDMRQQSRIGDHTHNTLVSRDLGRLADAVETRRTEGVTRRAPSTVPPDQALEMNGNAVDEIAGTLHPEKQPAAGDAKRPLVRTLVLVAAGIAAVGSLVSIAWQTPLTGASSPTPPDSIAADAPSSEASTSAITAAPSAPRPTAPSSKNAKNPPAAAPALPAGALLMPPPARGGAPKPPTGAEPRGPVPTKQAAHVPPRQPPPSRPVRKATRPTPSLTLTVGAVPPAAIRLDGKLVDSSPVVLTVTPGRHRLEARAGNKRLRRSVRITTDNHTEFFDLRDAPPIP